MLYFMCTVVVRAGFTVTPLNTVSIAGENTTLRCTSSAPISGWSRFFPNGSSCVVSSGYATQPGCADPSRYTVTPGTGGQFDLNIADTQTSDVGTYRCEEVGITPLLHTYAVHGVVGWLSWIYLMACSDCEINQ